MLMTLGAFQLRVEDVEAEVEQVQLQHKLVDLDQVEVVAQVLRFLVLEELPTVLMGRSGVT
jgi:hypothetical protein